MSSRVATAAPPRGCNPAATEGCRRTCTCPPTSCLATPAAPSKSRDTSAHDRTKRQGPPPVLAHQLLGHRRNLGQVGGDALPRVDHAADGLRAVAGRAAGPEQVPVSSQRAAAGTRKHGQRRAGEERCRGGCRPQRKLALLDSRIARSMPCSQKHTRASQWCSSSSSSSSSSSGTHLHHVGRHLPSLRQQLRPHLRPAAGVGGGGGGGWAASERRGAPGHKSCPGSAACTAAGPGAMQRDLCCTTSAAPPACSWFCPTHRQQPAGSAPPTACSRLGPTPHPPPAAPGRAPGFRST